MLLVGDPGDYDDESSEDNSEDDHNVEDEIEEGAEENPQSDTENADEPKEQAEAEAEPGRTRRSTCKSYRESGGEATPISTSGDSTAPASKPDDAETPVTSDESDAKKGPAVIVIKKTRTRARAKYKNQPLMDQYLSPKGGDRGVPQASESSRRVSGRGKM